MRTGACLGSGGSSPPARGTGRAGRPEAPRGMHPLRNEWCLSCRTSGQPMWGGHGPAPEGPRSNWHATTCQKGPPQRPKMRAENAPGDGLTPKLLGASAGEMLRREHFLVREMGGSTPLLSRRGEGAEYRWQPRSISRAAFGRGTLPYFNGKARQWSQRRRKWANTARFWSLGRSQLVAHGEKLVETLQVLGAATLDIGRGHARWRTRPRPQLHIPISAFGRSHTHDWARPCLHLDEPSPSVGRGYPPGARPHDLHGASPPSHGGAVLITFGHTRQLSLRTRQMLGRAIGRDGPGVRSACVA
ncbi:MAG: hypothetical protein RL375_4314 [Pseudomonadota bacterium]